MPTDKRELDNHWEPVAKHYARYCGSQRWYGQGYGERRRPPYFIMAGVLAVIGLMVAVVAGGL